MIDITNWKNTLHHGDCLEIMKDIPDKSIDMILCDLPYQITNCSWDTLVPFEPLWEQYKRIIKKNSVIVLTASQPFTSMLVLSNLKMFKYDWCWRKSNVSGFLNAKKRPLRQHEDIIVFCDGVPVYFPQLFTKMSPRKAQTTVKRANQVYGDFKEGIFRGIPDTEGYPRSVIECSTAYHAREAGLHPTQKPVALCEYLIKTYTIENSLVLDNCMGSGTTCLAAKNTGRNYIGIEKDENYFNIAKERIEKGFIENKSIDKEKKGFFK